MSSARAADAPLTFATESPDAAMLDLAHRVARFIATLDDADIARWEAAFEDLDASDERPLMFPAMFGAIGRRDQAV